MRLDVFLLGHLLAVLINDYVLPLFPVGVILVSLAVIAEPLGGSVVLHGLPDNIESPAVTAFLLRGGNSVHLYGLMDTA